jgi:hypothetical protein
MRFSVGGGIGPFRVSQRIGLPRGRSNSRPGYFAQFDTCTVKHRTIQTEDRCGRRHPNGIRAAQDAKRRAQDAKRRQAEGAAREHAQAECEAGRQTAETYAVLVARPRRLMIRAGGWGLLWLFLGLGWAPFFAVAALCVVTFVVGLWQALRVPPPDSTAPTPRSGKAAANPAADQLWEANQATLEHTRPAKRAARERARAAKRAVRDEAAGRRSRP